MRSGGFFLAYINARNLYAVNDYTFSFYLLSLHICTLWPYNSCQVLQPVNYWQGKGQSSSLECGDTHKLFNFRLQRSVVRKYWAGQRWGKHEIKRQAGKALHTSLWALGLCHRCSFALLYNVRAFDFWKHLSVVNVINFNALFNVLTWNTLLSIMRECLTPLRLYCYNIFIRQK